MKPSFVNTSKLKTLEQYGAALITSVISIQTLEGFQISAYKVGILDDDETELSKTICWELRRLMGLYKQQLENITKRVPELDQTSIINGLIEMSGKKPGRKKKNG